MIIDVLMKMKHKMYTFLQISLADLRDNMAPMNHVNALNQYQSLSNRNPVGQIHY